MFNQALVQAGLNVLYPVAQIEVLLLGCVLVRIHLLAVRVCMMGGYEFSNV